MTPARVVIIAKAPIAGFAKTRLAANLREVGLEQAKQAFMRAVLLRAAGMNAPMLDAEAQPPHVQVRYSGCETVSYLSAPATAGVVRAS